MEADGIAHGLDKFIFSNMRVRHVDSNSAAGKLLIRGAYADREEQKMLYNGVLYSQIDKSAIGKHITLVVELLPEEYCQKAENG